MNHVVYVVTLPKLGWDCVVGVYDGVSEEDLNNRYPESEGYVVCDYVVDRKV